MLKLFFTTLLMLISTTIFAGPDKIERMINDNIWDVKGVASWSGVSFTVVRLQAVSVITCMP